MGYFLFYMVFNNAAEGNIWLELLFLFMAIFMSGMAIASPVLIYYRKIIQLRVLVGDEGFVYIRGRRKRAIRWEQIKEVWQILYAGGGLVRYTAVLISGKKYHFGPPLQHVREFGRLLAHEVALRQLSEVAERYRAGETIAFGPVQLSQEVFVYRKERVRWSQVRTFLVREGIVCVDCEGKKPLWPSLPVRRIPNFFVFISLVNAAVRERLVCKGAPMEELETEGENEQPANVS